MTTRSPQSVVVSFEASPAMRDAIETTLGGLATVTYLPELEPRERTAALAAADALLAWGIRRELRGDEPARLGSVGLIQLMSAGVDHVSFEQLPVHVPVAANGGGWAEPMAEHVLAMTLALAKRLPQNHAALAHGIFDQRTPNRELHGAVVAILGYGGIGRASAKLFRALGARIHAVTRSGRVDEPVERVAALDQLGEILSAADVLIISLPLTSETRGLIGQRELALMKPDAILVNVARADIVDEGALYGRLKGMPTFSAGLDVWWQEPGRRDAFVTRHPFFDLPNVIGSPHNSANTTESVAGAARHAAENVARYLRGQPVQHVVDRREYLG
jgi:phosphoglycerate dehydrogenase-like enzyme